MSTTHDTVNISRRGGARPGAGRKKAQGLTHRVMIRLSEETLEKVKEQARKEGLTPSEMMRKILEYHS